MEIDLMVDMNRDFLSKSKPILDEILILGNGFDLALGLKTQFEDFLLDYSVNVLKLPIAQVNDFLFFQNWDKTLQWVTNMDNWWIRLFVLQTQHMTLEHENDRPDGIPVTWSDFELLIKAVLYNGEFTSNSDSERDWEGYNHSLINDYCHIYFDVAFHDGRCLFDVSEYDMQICDALKIFNNRFNHSDAECLAVLDDQLSDFEDLFWKYLTERSGTDYFNRDFDTHSVVNNHRGISMVNSELSDKNKKNAYFDKTNVDDVSKSSILLLRKAIKNIYTLALDSLVLSDYSEVHITLVTFNGKYLGDFEPHSLDFESFDSGSINWHFWNVHGPFFGDSFYPRYLHDGVGLTPKLSRNRNLNFGKLVFGVDYLLTDVKSHKLNFSNAGLDDLARFDKETRMKKLKEYLQKLDAGVFEEYHDATLGHHVLHNDIESVDDFNKIQESILSKTQNSNHDIVRILKSYGHSLNKIDTHYFDSFFGYSSRNIIVYTDESYYNGAVKSISEWQYYSDKLDVFSLDDMQIDVRKFKIE